MDDELRAATDFPPRFKDYVQVEVFDLRLLARMGVQGRPTSANESQAGLSGPLVYNDLPGAAEAFAAERSYAATRQDIQVVIALVERYNAVFGTAEQDRTAEIAREFAEASARWKALGNEGSFDAAAFRAWVRNTPEERVIAERIAQIEGLLGEMRKLGLTEPEYRQARQRLLRTIMPQGGATAGL
ncbi:MAG: hypothetical protein HBSAPP03_19010 [Phycisphaerae bacterium]|nr:MAG: hypothetical protein HBSAPP03_19010 [Phycisphaerae bacterium]